MMKRIVFSENELKFLTESPEALRALKDYHDIQETHADSAGADASAAYHRDRRAELERMATTIETAHSSGYGVDFEPVEKPHWTSLMREAARHLREHALEYSHRHPADLRTRMEQAIVDWNHETDQIADAHNTGFRAGEAKAARVMRDLVEYAMSVRHEFSKHEGPYAEGATAIANQVIAEIGVMLRLRKIGVVTLTDLLEDIKREGKIDLQMEEARTWARQVLGVSGLTDTEITELAGEYTYPGGILDVLPFVRAFLKKHFEHYGAERAYGYYRERPDENGGKEFFHYAMWHGDTVCDEGERKVRGVFIPE